MKNMRVNMEAVSICSVNSARLQGLSLVRNQTSKAAVKKKEDLPSTAW